jgi:hypothetical protein
MMDRKTAMDRIGFHLAQATSAHERLSDAMKKANEALTTHNMMVRHKLPRHLLEASSESYNVAHHVDRAEETWQEYENG